MKKLLIFIPRNIFIIFIFLLISGCSQNFVLRIPQKINKTNNVNILIPGFEDQTGQYKKSYEIEKKIAEKLKYGFKGLKIPSGAFKGGSYKENFPNPYNVYLTDSLSYILHDPDIIIKGTIEFLDYTFYIGGPEVHPVIAFPHYGKFAITGGDSFRTDAVLGIIGVRIEIINAHNKETIHIEMDIGRSGIYSPLESSREKAINQAIDQVTDRIVEIFSDGDWPD